MLDKGWAVGWIEIPVASIKFLHDYSSNSIKNRRQSYFSSLNSTRRISVWDSHLYHAMYSHFKHWDVSIPSMSLQSIHTCRLLCREQFKIEKATCLDYNFRVEWEKTEQGKPPSSSHLHDASIQWWYKLPTKQSSMIRHQKAETRRFHAHVFMLGAWPVSGWSIIWTVWIGEWVMFWPSSRIQQILLTRMQSAFLTEMTTRGGIWLENRQRFFHDYDLLFNVVWAKGKDYHCCYLCLQITAVKNNDVDLNEVGGELAALFQALHPN